MPDRLQAGSNAAMTLSLVGYQDPCFTFVLWTRWCMAMSAGVRASLPQHPHQQSYPDRQHKDHHFPVEVHDLLSFCKRASACQLSVWTSRTSRASALPDWLT